MGKRLPGNDTWQNKEGALNIVVCVKQVPDSAAVVSVRDGKVTWGDAAIILNPWDEYAVEVALQLTETHGGEVTALSLAGENEKEALKIALAMGAKSAVRIDDTTLQNLDASGTAQILAAAIRKISTVDLLTFGMQAIDSNAGVTTAQTARILGWPALTLVSKIVSCDPSARKIVVERATEEGKQIVEAQLPAVLNFVKEIAEPRYPSFMGIRKAAKAEIPTWSLADLGIPAPPVYVNWQETLNLPKQEIVTEMISGSTPQEIAENLVERLVAEKVI